jgi:DNA-binding transcriptional ArsR family regulator
VKTRRPMTSQQLALVAERFRVLAEPARLQLLQALMTGERSVGELTEITGLSQANVSKHLQLLLASDLVARRKDGLFVYYQIADESVFQLCDLVCRGLARSTRERHRRLVPG